MGLADPEHPDLACKRLLLYWGCWPLGVPRISGPKQIRNALLCTKLAQSGHIGDHVVLHFVPLSQVTKLPGNKTFIGSIIGRLSAPLCSWHLPFGGPQLGPTFKGTKFISPHIYTLNTIYTISMFSLWLFSAPWSTTSSFVATRPRSRRAGCCNRAPWMLLHFINAGSVSLARWEKNQKRRLR